MFNALRPFRLGNGAEDFCQGRLESTRASDPNSPLAGTLNSSQEGDQVGIEKKRFEPKTSQNKTTIVVRYFTSIHVPTQVLSNKRAADAHDPTMPLHCNAHFSFFQKKSIIYALWSSFAVFAIKVHFLAIFEILFFHFLNCPELAIGEASEAFLM